MYGKELFLINYLTITMERSSNSFKFPFIILTAAVAWIALIGQGYLNFGVYYPNDGLSLSASVIKFISFFTIESNILVAICLSYCILLPNSRTGAFFQKPTTQTAIAVYIFIVGLVYNLVLRFMWAPTGLQKIVDELLHVATPLLYSIYWFAFVPKGQLQYKDIFPWLIYPFLYIIYALTRGAFTNVYPYPFLEADKLGYPKVLFACGLITLAFITVGLIFIWLDKLIGKNNVAKNNS